MVRGRQVHDSIGKILYHLMFLQVVQVVQKWYKVDFKGIYAFLDPCFEVKITLFLVKIPNFSSKSPKITEKTPKKPTHVFGKNPPAFCQFFGDQVQHNPLATCNHIWYNRVLSTTRRNYYDTYKDHPRTGDHPPCISRYRSG